MKDGEKQSHGCAIYASDLKNDGEGEAGTELSFS